jgi:hypothetical protein
LHIGFGRPGVRGVFHSLHLASGDTLVAKPLELSCILLPLLGHEPAANASAGDEAPARAIFEMVRDVEPATIVLARSEHPGVLAAAVFSRSTEPGAPSRKPGDSLRFTATPTA